MLNRPPHMQVYPLMDIEGNPEFTRASAETVTASNGVEYLDMYAGHAVSSIGHSHPKWVEAIASQAGTLDFYSNVVDLQVRRAFCEKLISMAPERLSTVFLCNSGAEANENALTLARLATGRRNVVSVEGGFHGRTLQTLALSGIEKYRRLAAASDAPLLDNVRIIPRDDVDAVRAAIDETVSAVIVEPVQGLAGAVALGAPYLAAIRSRCSETGTVLIFDEVQCGSGRCGSLLAGTMYGVTPDIATLAKGLAGGFPVGAVIATAEIGATAGPGMLGSTFGGGPLACAAGLATLNVMTEENLFQNVDETGRLLRDETASIPGVAEVSGKGFLIGIRLDHNCAATRGALLERHHIITGSCTDPDVIRLLPPLTLKPSSARRFTAALSEVLKSQKRGDSPTGAR